MLSTSILRTVLDADRNPRHEYHEKFAATFKTGLKAMELDRVIICGLGSLGQHCILSLKEFGVSTIAIDLVSPQTWEVPNLVDALAELIIGDCRQNSVLEQAKIEALRKVVVDAEIVPIDLRRKSDIDP
jgi:D-arabinose 1-dehydrogenase-like Zn-dependent alcohol dehydrogenase